MTIKWHTEKRKISQLVPAEYNPREMTEKQAQDLTNSLNKFNLADPIVINQNNTIIGGHQRINILKAQGDIEVDVRIPDRVLTEEEEKELNLRLNKNLGQWDFDLLSSFNIEMLKEVGFTDLDIGLFEKEPSEDDWADSFDKKTLPKEIEGLKQITFVLHYEKIDEVLAILQTINKDRNEAFYEAIKAYNNTTN